MKKFTVNIKQFDWLDKENPEAEILFQINGKQFWAFCHPCDFREEEIAEVNFSVLGEEKVNTRGRDRALPCLYSKNKYFPTATESFCQAVSYALRRLCRGNQPGLK